MPKAKKVKKKLDKRIIRRYGLDTVLLRSSVANSSLNRYGEPSDPSTAFEEIDIRIDIATEKSDLDAMEIGGLSNDKKEMLYFYSSGSDDVRVGDYVVYPAGSENRWLIEFILPNIMNDTVVLNEVKAYKDDRF